MRNLKKVLTLVLCLAMMMSIMVVGAGAAFNDQEKIVNTEAVDACVALNIINGYTDGSYKPEGTITRAEACKMICVALNGGKEPALGTNVSTSFTDTNGHWAAGYIESCVSQGIVAGIGGGKFNPNGNVTGSQFAKMLLIALGYKADVESFTGSAWEVNVNVKATQKDLYDELASMDPSKELTRDAAAQMVWNALQAKEVEYEYTLATENGQLVSKITVKDGDYTLLEDKYNVDIVKGAILTTIDEDDKGTYNVTTTGTNGDSYTKVAKDYSDLMGQKVDVLVKDNDTSKVFGIYANEDSSVVATGLVDDLDTVTNEPQKIEVSDVEYKLDNTAANINVYDFNTNTSRTLAAVMADNNSKPFEIKLIDNDDNGKIDRAVIKPFTVSEVTYVGSTSLTIKSLGSKKLADVNAYEGIAKDDYVVITAAANTIDDTLTLTKAEVVTGKVTAVKDTNTLMIDGVWYPKYNSAADAFTDANLNDTLKLTVVNGFYFAGEVTTASEGASNVLYIGAADKADPTLGDYTVTAKAYFTDGTNKKIDIVEVNDVDVGENSTKALSSNRPTTRSYTDGNVVVGMMYRYEINKDGDYELYTLADTNSSTRAGYKTYKADASSASFNTSTDRLTVDSTSFIVADDAVVFVQAPYATSGDKIKVITGKALKKWANTSNLTAQVLANDANGAKTAQVAALLYTGTSAISAASDDSFGYVVATPTRGTNADGDKAWNYQIWNGSEVLSVYEDESSMNASKGDFVQFNLISSEEIEDLQAPATKSYAAVTAIDGDKIDVKLSDGSVKTALEIDSKDTDVIYVNSDKTEGVEGGSIQLADEPASGIYTMNVYIAAAALSDGQTLDVIFVDVNNKMESATYSAAVNTASDVLSATATYTLTVTGGATSAEDATVTLKVTTSVAAVPTGGKTITVKCDQTGETKTVEFAAGDTTGTEKTVTFAQKAYNTTYSIVGGN